MLRATSSSKTNQRENKITQSTTPVLGRTAVITITYNNKLETTRLLSQLEQQTTKPDIVIIVDNSEPVHQYSENEYATLSSVSYHVELIRSSINRGFAGGLNDGLGRALELRATDIFVSNSDITLKPNALEEMLTTAHDSPAPITGCYIAEHDDLRLWYGGGQYQRYKGTIRHLRYGDTLPLIDKTPTTTTTDWVSGCFFHIAGEHLSELGPLDESFFLYREECDWQLRYQHIHNKKPAVLDKVLLSHTSGGTTGGTNSGLGRAFMTRNYLKLALRYAGLAIPAWIGRVILFDLIGPLLNGHFNHAKAAWSGVRTIWSEPETLLTLLGRPIQHTRKGIIALYLPETRGGHPRYGHALATSIVDLLPDSQHLWYVCSRDHPIVATKERLTYARISRPMRRNPFKRHIHKLASRFLHYLLRDFELLRWLATHNEVRIIHLQQWTPWNLSVFCRIAHRRGIRVIATVHNVRPHRGDTVSTVMSRLEMRALASLDELHVHDTRSAEDLYLRLPRPCPRIEVIGHGLFPEMANTFRNTSKTALFFGNIRRNKNLHLLIEAISTLPEWRLQVYGYPEDQVYATECLERISGRVDFHLRFIPDDEIAGIFAEARVCVLPYGDFNAQSGVLHLSLGAGTPVLVSDAGGLSEVVRKYECGLVIQSVTSSTIATGLREFESETHLQCWRQGVESARDQLSWHSVAQVTVDSYQRVLQS